MLRNLFTLNSPKPNQKTMKNQKSKVNKGIASSSSMARKRTKSSRRIPLFFKVLDNAHFSQHLKMPPAYINHFSQLPSKCMLRGPSGKLWTVGLEERQNGLFFHGGWRRFVRDHALDFGNFLVFAYDGKSIFNVKIYDHSCCEKKESQVPIELHTESSDEEDNEEEEELDSESSSSEDIEEEELDTDFSEGEDSGVDELDSEDTEEEAVISKKRKSSNWSGKRHAIVKAKETSTTHVVFSSRHLCFAATYMKNQYRVQIPRDVAVAAGLDSQKSVKLEDPKGRLWIVTLRQSDRLLMTVGWVPCYRANDIAVGDTVVFELVKKTTMKVHIFRGDASGRMCSLVLDCPRPCVGY